MTDVPDGELPDAGAEDPGIARSGRSALWVGAGILASRLVGLVRQRVFAHYFGDSWIADAFQAALRLPNITQNLLGEGTLSATFIPIYVQLRSTEPARASRFARDALGRLLLLTAIISILGAIFAVPVTRLFLPGFTGERRDLAVHLVRILFPMTGMLTLSAWSLGVLNSHRRFFLAYLAPVFWNLTQIFALIFGARFTFGASLAVVAGDAALLGAGLQVAVQLPSVRNLLGSIVPRFTRSTDEIRRAVRSLGPVILGRGVVQLSAQVDSGLASLLPVGAVSALSYAQTIYLLPVSLFGIGGAAAALPEMARQAAEGASGRFKLKAQLAESLTRLAFTTVPAMLVFWVLPDQIVGAVFQTGKFDASSTHLVGSILAVYGTVLLANAGVRVLASAFFALGDTTTPARYAIARVVVSIGLSYLLMRRFGVVGLAAGSAVGGWLEALLLATKAHRQLEGLPLPLGRWLKIIVAAVVAAGVGYLVKELVPLNQVLVKAAASLGAFGLAYLAAAWALRVPDVRGPLAIIGRRFGR